MDCVESLAIWAPGADDHINPPNMGVRIGKGAQYKSLLLQMHYTNPELKARRSEEEEGAAAAAVTLMIR
jgi:hypothetical protein